MNSVTDLFQSHTANNMTISFDGFAFHHAKGKTFDDLMSQPAIQTLLNSLPRNLREAYFKEALEMLGESTQFTIGDLSHSLASCMIKIALYQKGKVPPVFLNEYQLLDEFEKMEREWKEKKNYLIHPILLVASHLAASNDHSISASSWQEQVNFLLNYLKESFCQMIGLQADEEFDSLFDNRAMARKILEKQGMLERD